MSEPLVNYYELLQISPTAEPLTIQRVYRLLAARYHPDNPETADPEKFLALQEAYSVLSNPERRAAYDARSADDQIRPLPVFELKEFVAGIEAEVNRRVGVLCLLYNRRRSHPDSPGLSLLDLETIMSLPREHLEFAVWYLRAKNLLCRTDSSELTLTPEGVDWVEAHARSNRIVRTLLQAPEDSSVLGESTACHPEESDRAVNGSRRPR